MESKTISRNIVCFTIQETVRKESKVHVIGWKLGVSVKGGSNCLGKRE